MQILSVRTENTMMIELIEFEPKKGMTIIGGENGQGKSSELKSIEWCLFGISKRAWADPVRTGADESKTTIVLGEDGKPMFIVTKIIYPGKKASKLIVSTPEGATFNSAQTMLDKITGGRCIDPLKFFLMKANEQTETAANFAGIDLTKLNQAYDLAYEGRKPLNARVKDLEAQFKATVFHDEVVFVDVADLSVKLQEANESQEGSREADTAHINAIERGNEMDRHLAAREKELKTLKATIAKQKAQRKEHSVTVSNLKQSLLVCEDALIDPAPIMTELEGAQENNALVSENDQRAKLETSLKEAKEKASKADDEVKECAAKRTKIISAAHFPLEGMGFDENGLTWQGHPFKQAGGADQLRVSTKMGFALGKGLKCSFIHDGSNLDDKSLALIDEITNEAGGCLFVAMPRTGKIKPTIIIEAGKVKGAKTKKAKIKKENKDETDGIKF